MTCEDIIYNLPDYLRKPATAEISTAIDTHVRECLSCRKEAEDLKRLFERMEQRNVPSPSDAYWNSLVPRIHERLDRMKAPRNIPEGIRMLLPASMATLLLIFLSNVHTFDVTREDQIVHSMLHQLRAAELQHVAQILEYEETYESPKSAGTTDDLFAADVTALKELFEEEGNAGGDLDFDQEYTANIINDDDALDIITKLGNN